MDALAAEAFLNAPHRVYGLAMRPLSLGHSFTLEAIGSPFYHGKLGTRQELRLAAWICSRPPLAVPQMSGPRFWVWRILSARHTFLHQVERWKTYVADYCAPPQMWSKTTKAGDREPEPSRIPGALATVARLMLIGMTERQAWSTPVGAAAWYEAAHYEAETGQRLDIVTDSERLAILRSKARAAAEESK
jgi:hypothetical protein